MNQRDPIFEFSDYAIDLSKIESIGPIYGDPEWRRYYINFTGGGSIEIYQSRQGYGPQMKREILIGKWREYKNKA